MEKDGTMLYFKITSKLAAYRELISYIFWGVITTVINYGVYFLCTRYMSINVLWSTYIAWLLAVLFAFVTNKIYVFKAHQWQWRFVLKELNAFVCCRLASGAFELISMWVLVDILGFYDLLVKIMLNVIVTAINYIFSKYFIFGKSA